LEPGRRMLVAFDAGGHAQGLPLVVAAAEAARKRENRCGRQCAKRPSSLALPRRGDCHTVWDLIFLFVDISVCASGHFFLMH
jgi:hypothetical protein